MIMQKRGIQLNISEAYYLWQAKYWTVAGNLLENTIRGYISIFEHHILPVIGNSDVNNIDYEKLQSYYDSLSNSGIKPKTIRNINQALQSLLNWCFLKHIMTDMENPKIVLPKRRGGNDVSNSISEEEYSMLQPFITGHFKYAIQFYAATGLRPEEIGILKNNIDIKNKTIKICTAIKRKYVDYKHHKTVLVLSHYLKTNAAYRVIPITPNVQNLIESQNKMLLSNNITSEYLFCNTNGNLIEPRNLLRSFYSALQRAGLQKRGLNSLRKLYIHRMVVNGMKPKTLQKLVGHEEYSTTMKYYLEITDKEKIEEAFEVYNRMTGCIGS